MIAVDASIALKLVLNETDSEVVRSVWQGWAEAGELLVAPLLFRPETFSVLRRKVYQGLLTDDEGNEAYGVLESLPVHFREPVDLYQTAWQFAGRFNRPTIHDTCYLVLASSLGCGFWTADRRLANAVGSELTWLRSLAM